MTPLPKGDRKRLAHLRDVSNRDAVSPVTDSGGESPIEPVCVDPGDTWARIRAKQAHPSNPRNRGETR